MYVCYYRASRRSNACFGISNMNFGAVSENVKNHHLSIQNLPAKFEIDLLLIDLLLIDLATDTVHI
jgi:hypothetical protein